MTEQKATTTMAEEKVAPVEEVFVPKDPIFINTKHGTVSVYGHEFLAKKELMQLGYALTLEEFEDADHRVRMVTFLDTNKPCRADGKPVLASVIPEAGVIIINLQKHFSQALKLILKDENKESSIQAVYHNLMCQSYLHELHHLTLGAELPDNIDKLPEAEQTKWLKKVEEDETDAEEWAQKQSWDMAKFNDIEPPPVAESPFFSEKVEEAIGLLRKDDRYKDIAEDQRFMLDNHVMLHIPADGDEEEFNATSFRMWCHLMSGEDENNEEWTTKLPENNRMDELIKELGEALPGQTQPTPVVGENPVSAVPGQNGILPTHESMMDLDRAGEFYGDYGEEPPEMVGIMAGGIPQQVYYTNPTPAAPVAPVTPAPAPAFAPTQAPGYGQPMGNAFQQNMPTMAPNMSAAMPNGYEQPKVQHEPTGLSDDETVAVVRGVYAQMYNIIFDGPCQQLINSDLAFQNVHAVSNVPIQLSPTETKVIMAYSFLDANGRWTPKVLTKVQEGKPGVLRGFVTKTNSLPMYKIFINHGGNEVCRIVIPQNTAKRMPSGELTRTAAMARQGTRILHIMDGTDTPAGTKSNYISKIVDGQYIESN